MTKLNVTPWLLVALAVVVLAVAAPAVSAHGNDSATDEAPPENGTAADWASWMDGHMTDHMGPGATEWMESHAGVTVDEMAQYMAEGDYDHRVDDDHVADDHYRGSGDYDRGSGNGDARGTPGGGHGC